MNIDAMMQAVEAGEDYIIMRGGAPFAVVIAYEKYTRLIEEFTDPAAWPVEP